MTMLILGLIFAPLANAKEELKETPEPSAFEQGLIDLLESNAADLPIDSIIADYCKANKEQIQISNKKTSNKPVLRTYELKDGSDITFTDQYFFFVTSTTEENQSTTETDSLSSKTTLQYTPTITASQSFYNIFGTRLFTIYAKGYYRYQVSPATVETHFTDAWYSLGSPTVFQVTNWKEGGINYLNTHTGEIYGSGQFHWGFEVQGVGLVLYNKYIKVYSTCDQFGNIHRQYIMQ